MGECDMDKTPTARRPRPSRIPRRSVSLSTLTPTPKPVRHTDQDGHENSHEIKYSYGPRASVTGAPPAPAPAALPVGPAGNLTSEIPDPAPAPAPLTRSLSRRTSIVSFAEEPLSRSVSRSSSISTVSTSRRSSSITNPNPNADADTVAVDTNVVGLRQLVHFNESTRPRQDQLDEARAELAKLRAVVRGHAAEIDRLERRHALELRAAPARPVGDVSTGHTITEAKTDDGVKAVDLTATILARLDAQAAVINDIAVAMARLETHWSPTGTAGPSPSPSRGAGPEGVVGDGGEDVDGQIIRSELSRLRGFIASGRLRWVPLESHSVSVSVEQASE